MLFVFPFLVYKNVFRSEKKSKLCDKQKSGTAIFFSVPHQCYMISNCFYRSYCVSNCGIVECCLFTSIANCSSDQLIIAALAVGGHTLLWQQQLLVKCSTTWQLSNKWVTMWNMVMSSSPKWEHALLLVKELEQTEWSNCFTYRDCVILLFCSSYFYKKSNCKLIKNYEQYGWMSS